MGGSEVVLTDSGRIRGRRQDMVLVFKGIPYGNPPVGPNRFTPPQPVKPWDDVFDASKSSPIAPQPPPRPELTMFVREQSEADCLSLNIWTPGSDDKKRPVLFWIHGGSLLTGSNADFNGRPMATRSDVVVIAINYRLGPLGFLYVPSKTANVGILDQVEALKWVNRIIKFFGGDPSDVTIFGESGGGVSALMSMPRAKGPFKRAIVESNVCNPNGLKPENGETVAKRLFSILRFQYGEMEALRSIPVEKLIEAYQKAIAGPIFSDTYPPFIGGDVLPVHPYEAIKKGAAKGIELLAGTNENEGGSPSLWDPDIDKMDEKKFRKRVRYYRSATGETEAEVRKFFKVYAGEIRADPFDSMRYAFEQFAADHFFRIPVQRYLEAQCKYQPRVYSYLFSWKTPELGGKLGATHALEIPFVFNTLGDNSFGIFPKKTDRISFNMMDAQVNFARRGDPNHIGILRWPAYNAKTRSTMVFDKDIRVENDPFAERNEAWKGAI